MGNDELLLSSSIFILCMEISSTVSWKPHILTIAKKDSRKLGFLFRARKYFTSSQLLALYKSQFFPQWSTVATFGVALPVFSYWTSSSAKPYVLSMMSLSPQFFFSSLFFPHTACIWNKLPPCALSWSYIKPLIL